MLKKHGLLLTLSDINSGDPDLLLQLESIAYTYDELASNSITDTLDDIIDDELN